MFIEIRDPHDGKLLFRFDPDRDLVEVQRKRVKTLIDLSVYRPQSAAERHSQPIPAPQPAK
jgi:hypothetical protein